MEIMLLFHDTSRYGEALRLMWLILYEMKKSFIYEAWRDVVGINLTSASSLLPLGWRGFVDASYGKWSRGSSQSPTITFPHPECHQAQCDRQPRPLQMRSLQRSHSLSSSAKFCLKRLASYVLAPRLWRRRADEYYRASNMCWQISISWIARWRV